MPFPVFEGCIYGTRNERDVVCVLLNEATPFRFGFRSDLAHDASLEDKAERLRRKAEDEKDNVITEVLDGAADGDFGLRHYYQIRWDPKA